MSYSSTSILALAIHFLINHNLLKKDMSKDAIPAQKSYRSLLFSITAYYVTDAIWGLLYERHWLGLTFLDTQLYFVAMAFTVLMWTKFAVDYLRENGSFGKVLLVMGQLIFAFQLILVLATFVRPIMFSFDEKGVYHAGIGRYITLAAQIVMFAITAIYAASVSRKSTGTKKARYRTIGMFSVTMAVFDVLQTRYSLLPMYAIGCLLGTCLLNSFVLENEKEEYRGDLEERLRESIEKDMLTGLPAMTSFFRLAETEKNAVLKRGGEPALLYMDFSGMKFYNGKYGFEEGDKLLKEFAGLLVRYYGNDRSSRLGGDHFAVITEMSGLEDRLHQMFHDCRNLNGGKSLPIHVGVYSDGEGRLNASLACDRARLACDELSGAYASCYRYYTQKLSDKAEMRQYIVENIDRAIEERWIQVFYQPIIRAVNEKVCDEEALARWIDPVKGFLSPGSFIPALEDAGLIYKMDLYVLERVLEDIHTLKEEGLFVVPHSINLSRSDFDACDIVEEIRRRVDEAGVDRSLITIEITESVIGGSFEFMKEQVERFRDLGFPVWMDDFGSGYSSLDVLQSIPFDLIKFDMSFMRKLDEGDGGKIILTELMKMATSLGVDTVCEGVETKDQVRFLREIGCSKLQGFYFSKPVPFETLRSLRESNTLIPRENPQESNYYERIGRVNLFDLSFLANMDDSETKNTFNTVPMGIMDVNAGGDKVKYVRSNPSFRDFMRRAFGFDLSDPNLEYTVPHEGPGSDFMKAIEQSKDNNNRAFVDEKMQDGSTARSFVRVIGKNPVNGRESVAIAVLSVSEPSEGETYADIAQALAADYYNIYVIDLDTNDYIEYSSQVGGEELSVVRHGEDFFESARRDTMTRIYEEDREDFLDLFTKENVLRDIDKQGVFTTTYRLIDTGSPVYVNMKITRMHGGNRLILGISIIDAHMKEQEEARRLRQERVSLGRIAALAGNYIALYIVDPVTEQFYKYSSSTEYAQLGLTEQGEAFFDQVITDGRKVLYPEDRERLLYVLTKDNVLREIRRNGLFVHNYRLLIEGAYVPVSLRATLLREDDGEKILFGVNRLFSKEPSTNESEVIYTHIAQALAREYTDLYYVNIDTDEFIEFQTDSNLGVLTEARRGADFFEGCKRDVKLFVHPEDEEAFIRTMDPDFLRNELEKAKEYKLIYRRIKNRRSFYVQMNISRLEDDPHLLVMAVSDIDELMIKRQSEERMLEERIIYARLHALTGNFIVVYVVDPETDAYREFSATDNYVESYAQAKEGVGFFEKVREVAHIFNYPEDMDRFLAAFTKENIMTEIERSGFFTLGYRFMMEGKPIHVQMKAAMVEEKEGPRLIVGLNNIDAQVRQEESLEKRLAQAQSQASIDALTGVKNKHAYLVAEAKIDRWIAERRQAPFAIVFLDLNDLKKVNDTAGHQAGDQYLRDACRIICDIFKHSPVFRVGGDEFAVIAQGKDYDCLEELLEKMSRHNAEASRTGGIVIAYGCAKYEDDACVATVFDRADHEMYENKNELKSRANTTDEQY